MGSPAVSYTCLPCVSHPQKPTHRIVTTALCCAAPASGGLGVDGMGPAPSLGTAASPASTLSTKGTKSVGPSTNKFLPL